MLGSKASLSSHKSDREEEECEESEATGYEPCGRNRVRNMD